MNDPAKILIVEDSALLADAFRTMLERAGFVVLVAHNIAQAAAAERADLVLVDLTLPDGDGLSLLPLLASSGKAPAVAMALSGHDDPDTRERVRESGCVELLVKPVSLTELAARAHSLLNEFRSDSSGRAE